MLTSVLYILYCDCTYHLKCTTLTMGILLVSWRQTVSSSNPWTIKLKSPKYTFCELLREKSKLISKLVLHSINSKWIDAHSSTKFPSSVNLWRERFLIQLSTYPPTPTTYMLIPTHVSVVTENQIKMLWRSPYRISDALQPYLCGIEVWRRWKEVGVVASTP